MTAEEELNEFIRKLEVFSTEHCPKWLTPNSNFFGIEPGHNLDLVKIAFDYRIDRTWLLTRKDLSSGFLSDPSGPPTLGVVK